MKKMHNFKKLMAVVLCVLMNLNLSRAQISNGDFETALGGNGACDAGAVWVTAPSPLDPQYVVTGSNAWIDITPCWSFGNGSWIEQNAATIAGKWYYVELDLGAHNGWQVWDAGVVVSINGTPLGSRLYNNTFLPASGSINWKTVRTCLFQATSSSTTIRIEGLGANPLAPWYPSPNAPGVMGLDNVELIDADNMFNITATPTEECNKVCFNLNNLFSVDPPVVYNIDWYVDNALELSGSNTYCRKMPKNVTKQIKAVISFNDNCANGTLTVTLPYTATDDCPCDLQQHALLEAIGLTCNSYQINLKLDPGYISLFTHWTLDGQPVSGSISNVIVAGLSPGTHVICANIIGGVEGEPDNVCCARVCITVEVGQIVETECTVEVPNCDQIGNVDLVPCPECQATMQNATLVGPLQHLGYDPNTGKRILRREYTDANNCRKCIVTYYVNDVLPNPQFIWTINTNGQLCITLSPGELPDCLKNASGIMVFLNGHPDSPTSFPGGSPITLCCSNVDNVPNPTYYLYSLDDPCCFAIITLNCDGSAAARNMVNAPNTLITAMHAMTGPALRLNPNPSSSVFYIQSEAKDQVYQTVEIMDMTGRLVLHLENQTPSSKIDMRGYSAGTYFVNVKSSMGNSSLKLILKND